MSTYNTGNAVPSTDPRDLDDNAKVFDELLMSTDASVPDRLGEQRKTWRQMEQDAEGLVSPNVAALAAAVAAANKGLYFSSASPVAISTYDLSAYVRGLGVNTTSSAFRSAIGAMALTDTGAFAGSAAKLGAVRTIAASGDLTWSVNFDGSANVTAAAALSTTGVSAGTYGAVTVNTKGLVTAASTATPIANGGTGQTTQATALTALLASSVVPVANGGTGLSALGAGVATFLGAPSSANLLAAVTDETGTGALVFAISPTLVTPNIGAATAGSISRGAPVVQTGNFTVGTADNWLLCNGAASITVTLPAPASFTGREIMIKTIAAQTVVSASANVAPLIGGAASTAILSAAAGKWATLVSNGTNWVIMQSN
jgi:hypothetical protein